MKIRLAKKIMKEAHITFLALKNKQKTIPRRYWCIDFLLWFYHEAGDKRYAKDHRITKAISLTRKKK